MHSLSMATARLTHFSRRDGRGILSASTRYQCDVCLSCADEFFHLKSVQSEQQRLLRNNVSTHYSRISPTVIIGISC